MSEQPEARLEALKSHFLQDALEVVLGGAPEAAREAGCDAESLQVLRQTTQVADAMRHLQLGTASADDGSQPAGCPASSDTAADSTSFVGAPSTRLGVAAADLLAEALPPEHERQRALEAALPALEAVLRQRCVEVAAASGYSAEDFSGLPGHIHQLQAAVAAQQQQQAEVRRKAAEQVGEAVGLLARACQTLADIIKRHKLGLRKCADEAHAEALHAQCVFLREKLRVVQLQLQEATYSAAMVPVLQQVAREVDGALSEATAQLQQASARLAQYKSLGPGFAALAAEHGGVLEALEEAEFELREIEQFAALAAVTG